MEQANPQPSNHPVFVNTDNENSLLKYQLDTDPTVEAIRMMLLNMHFDYKNQQYVEGKPLYNVEYINRIMEAVKSLVNKDLILSGYNHLQISNEVTTTMTSISCFQLSISNMEGGISDVSLTNMILNSILNYLWSSINRALDYKTLTHTGKGSKYNEFANMSPDMGYPMPPQQFRGGGRF